MNEPQNGISVIIPVYNSASTLPALVMRLKPILESQAGQFELVFVNDGSSDRSWQVITELASAEDRIHGISLMKNYGQHNALLCGIRAAKYDVCITMDDDLQNPPEEIPRLIAKLNEGHDVVYGTPQVRRHGFWRTLAADITRVAIRAALGADIAYKASAFRAFRTVLREAFSECRSPHVSIDVLLTWGTSDFASIAVHLDARSSGVSNYTFKKLAIHALNMITGFSTLPLRLASLMGFGFTLFGFGVLVYVVGRYLIHGSSVPGFPFLASVIAVFSGVQLFCLGILGEYLARMHFRMMERPTYSIRREIRPD
ncbi:MAG: glycosyltransferase family 2 protein [Desulfomonile tiedjei]|uniref:Glycosyltransferase family 2 protein n=1 Tax=Desulfomonile tiedjei TaxID=2358 RepID=A0A9D6V1P3_9BACT|nr:glycosyltransferase family 2 protein [Desulfomonile tiedjei]